jgi:hypothetical protein
MKLTTVLIALAVGLSGQITFGQTIQDCRNNTDGNLGQETSSEDCRPHERPAGSSGAIFPYTGSDQTFTVPAGVHMLWVEAWGGGGGGGYARSIIPVTPSETLTVTVGGGGGFATGLGGGFGGGCNNLPNPPRGGAAVVAAAPPFSKGRGWS